MSPPSWTYLFLNFILFIFLLNIIPSSSPVDKELLILNGSDHLNLPVFPRVHVSLRPIQARETKHWVARPRPYAHI